MSRSSLSAVDCGAAQALDILGEWWTLLILRNAFHGMRTFDAFQEHLGISSSVLSARLKKLCEAEVLEKRPSAHDGRSFEYRLTERGLELYPVMVGLVLWGEKWFPNGRGPRVKLRERRTGELAEGVHLMSKGGQPLSPFEVVPEAGPGADDKFRALIDHRQRRAE